MLYITLNAGNDNIKIMSKQIKVLIFNGPPGSGKDTAADYIEQHFQYKHLRFKDGLLPLVLTAYRVSREWWDEHYTRELKNIPHPNLCGQSPREALINMSENVIKPNFGESAFGDIAVRHLDPDRNVFSDGGFIEELRPVVDAIGPENILIVQLHRDNCTFENDSRSYYPNNVLGCKTIQITNNKSIDEFHVAIVSELY